MRVLVGFLVVSGLALAAGLLMGALLPWHWPWREISALMTIAYGSALVSGVPCFLLLRALHRHGWYSFPVAGAITGLATYWVVYEMLPVSGAYREGRYGLGQALAALGSLNQPAIGLYAAGTGAFAGLMLWLIVCPSVVARDRSPR